MKQEISNSAMGLTTNSSPIPGTRIAEAAQALLLLSGAASEVIPPKPTSEEIEKDALLTLTNNFYLTPALSPPSRILKPKHKEVKMEVSNLTVSSIPSEDQTLPVMHNESTDLIRNGRKRRHSSRHNSLHEGVRKSVIRNCRKIFANATEETLPHLRDELGRFISELYSKGICDEELANIRNKETATTRYTESPTVSFDDASDDIVRSQEPHEPKEKFTRKLSSSYKGPSGDTLIPIGKGHAKVQARVLRHMNWGSYTACTRKLLTAVFSRDVLATHSLTGKSSPAFPDKPAKKKLDPLLVNDIIKTIVDKCAVSESQVRTSITTKCADESKMFRTREQKETKGKGRGKRSRENIPPSTSDSDD